MAFYWPYEAQHNEVLSCVDKDDDIKLLTLIGDCQDKELLNAALYNAAENARQQCLMLLCSLNADVNYWNSSQDETVLGVACLKSHHEVIRSLITAGADVNRRSGGNLHAPIHSAARSGSVDCVELLVQNKANINQKDCFNNTALLIACREGHADVVRYMLVHGAVHTVKNVANNTAFSLAMDNGHSGCVRELLRAYPALACSRNKEGIYPLTSAIRHRKGQIVRAFVDSGCDVNCPEAALLTPLHLAIEMEDEDLVCTLARGGARLNHPLPLPMRPTPLMVAVAKGNAALVRLLVEHGADMSILDSLQRSALYLATKFGYLQCMDALLRGGADPNLYHAPTQTEMACADFTLPAPTPLHGALIYARDDEAAMLLQAGSNPDLESLYTQDLGLSWQPPMHIACERGMRWAVKLLIRSGSNCLEQAANFKDMDEELIHLLELAYARKSNPNTLKCLCRESIRGCLGLGLFQKVESLGLPWPLQSFLLCGELAFN